MSRKAEVHRTLLTMAPKIKSIIVRNDKKSKHQGALNKEIIQNQGKELPSLSAKFICKSPECGITFPNGKLLLEHKRRHHRIVPSNYLCEVCGYVTRFAHNLRTHARVHSGDKPYCCDECGACFASLTQLKAHSFVHNSGTGKMSKQSFNCKLCRVSFRSPKILYHHNKLHSSQKSYICSICGSAFAQAAGISQHMRWHDDQHRRGFPSKLTIEMME